MKPVVLIHGWGVNARVWEPVQALLPCPNLALDLPGYGTRTADTCPNQLADLASDLLARAPANAIWVGWSLGGMVALEAARQAPARISQLLLICSTPRFVRSADWPFGTDIDQFRQFAGSLAKDYARALRRFLLLQAGSGTAADRSLASRIADLCSSSPAPSAATLAAGLCILEQTDLRESLPSLQVPIGLIGGALDSICHPGATGWMGEHLGIAPTMGNFGHAPLLSDAQLVATLIEQMLAKEAS